MFWSLEGSWGRITAGRVHHPRLETRHAARDQHFAAFVVGAGVRIERRFRGAKWQAIDAAGDTACFVQAGREVEWAARSPFSAVNVLLPDGLFEHAISHRGSRTLFDETPHSSPNPAGRQIAELLVEEMRAGNPMGLLYADALSLALSLQLVNRDKQGRTTPRHNAGGLTTWQAKRTVAFMEARLGMRITLAAIAAEVGLGVHHFARCFRHTFGVPPYAYLMELRMERARSLLAGTPMPLAEVAIAVGYEGGSAFGAAFRRVIGRTPGEVRRHG